MNEPMTDAELDIIEARWSRYVALRDPDSMETSVHDVPDLLAEVYRLRSALTALDRNERAAANRALELQEELAAGNASDGYHTHAELYDYRMLYNAHAAAGWLDAGYRVVKSWKHSDGELCFGGGWFVVCAELPTGQVTNHYEAKHWSLFNIPETVPPEYDGHSPAEAADRLRAALDQSGEGQADA